MTTTIGPVPNTGNTDEGFGPTFPSGTGRGMGFESSRRLLESGTGTKFPKPKVEPKRFLKAAEGQKTVGKGKKKVKKGSKPENLRVGESKSKKRGAFGEVYKAAEGAKGKGVRVAESGGRYLPNGKKKPLQQRMDEGFYPEIA
jgi:hypothetical protein